MAQRDEGTERHLEVEGYETGLTDIGPERRLGRISLDEEYGMLKRRGRNRVITAWATATVLALSACGGYSADSGSDAKTLKIGMLLALSGFAAPFGTAERDAVKAIVEDVNEDGGVNGRKIELEIYDGAADPTKCVNGVNELAEKGVVAIIGPSTGSCALAAGPIAARRQIPLMTPTATIQVTSEENPFYEWVFRADVNDKVITDVLFRNATNDATALGIFYQQDAYGKDTTDYIVDELAKDAGVNVVAAASAPVTATNVQAQATRIRAADPDVVIMQSSSAKLGAAFGSAANQVDLTAPLWGGAALGMKSFVESAGEAAEGMHIVLLANPHSPSPRLKKLAELMEDAGKPITGFGEALGGVAVQAILSASAKIDGPLTGSQIRDALETVCEEAPYQGGKMCFEDDHDALDERSLELAVIKDGEFTPVGSD